VRHIAEYPEPSYRDVNDMRLVEIIKDAQVPVSGGVNILGVPFDGAVLGRRGAAGGPSAIRRAMSGFSNYNIELGVRLSKAKISDLGDVVFDGNDVVRAHGQVEAEVAAGLDEESLLVVLGGDNSVSLPSLRACAKKLGKIGVLVIDSHLDLRGEIGGRPTSGSSYGLALETIDGLDPQRVVELGAHGFLNSKKYFDKAERLGIRLMTAQEVREMGPEAAAREACRVASRGADAVYLSVDVDAIDLSEVSGVSAPSSGGLNAADVCKIVYEVVKGGKVACADIVELAPSLDQSGRSERVAATVLTYAVAGFLSRK
jgi:formiminoglutamase